MVTSNGKDLIFIFDEDGAKEFIESARRRTDKDFVIVCANKAQVRRLLNLGFVCKLGSDYRKEGSAELHDAISWMKKWPDEHILDGKSLKEILVYDGISIYWFLQARFYLHRLRELVLLIEQIKSVIEVERPDKIWVNGGNDEIRFIISNLYGAQNIAGFHQSLGKMGQSNISYKSYRGYPMLKLILLKIFRSTFFSSDYGQSSSAKSKILVITEVSQWRRDFDYELQRYEVRDVFFHDIVRRLIKSGYNVTVVDFENRKGQLLKASFTNKSRRASFRTVVNPWEKYVSIGTLMKSRKASKHFNSLLEKLSHADKDATPLYYKGIPIYPLIKDNLRDLLGTLKGFAVVTFLEAARRIIEIERPKVVIMIDEYGALQLSIIKAAREKGIPTLSIQHGLISPEQIAYVHESDHIIGNRSELLFPIPDRMCVWSEIAKQNLIEMSKFPPAAIFVTGDPKVDFLPLATSFFNYDQIIEKVGIKDKDIIVFATENLPSAQEKSLITRNVFNTFSKLPDCHLIIKMHPNETDASFYEREAEEAKVRDYSIIRDTNLYELLYVSKVVILSYSTVALEAMRMNKPVISLDLMNLHSNVSFVKNRRVIVVNNSEDLLPAIRKCLSNEQEVKRIIQEGKIFAEQELGQADGKASERIVELIIELDQNALGISSGEADSIGHQ